MGLDSLDSAPPKSNHVFAGTVFVAVNPVLRHLVVIDVDGETFCLRAESDVALASLERLARKAERESPR